MMRAIVTNRTDNYKYEIKDIVAINYVERTIILVSVEDGATTPNTHTYNSDEVIISIM